MLHSKPMWINSKKLRSIGAHSLVLTGTLPCAFRLIPNSLSRAFSRLSAYHKKTTLSGGLYWWALRGSNSRPSRCKRDALPAELNSHSFNETVYNYFKTINQAKNSSLCDFFYSPAPPPIKNLDIFNKTK